MATDEPPPFDFAGEEEDEGEGDDVLFSDPVAPPPQPEEEETVQEVSGWTRGHDQQRQ